MFEMQIIRSHPGPTELWTGHPTAVSPGDSDTQENRRTGETLLLNSKVKLNWFVFYLTLGGDALFLQDISSNFV